MAKSRLSDCHVIERVFVEMSADLAEFTLKRNFDFLWSKFDSNWKIQILFKVRLFMRFLLCLDFSRFEKILVNILIHFCLKFFWHENFWINFVLHFLAYFLKSFHLDFHVIAFIFSPKIAERRASNEASSNHVTHKICPLRSPRVNFVMRRRHRVKERDLVSSVKMVIWSSLNVEIITRSPALWWLKPVIDRHWPQLIVVSLLLT